MVSTTKNPLTYIISEDESRKIYICREALSLSKIRGILSYVNFSFTMEIEIYEGYSKLNFLKNV